MGKLVAWLSYYATLILGECLWYIKEFEEAPTLFLSLTPSNRKKEIEGKTRGVGKDSENEDAKPKKVD